MFDRKNQLLRAVFISVTLLVADQLCKAWAVHTPGFSFYLINPWLGWEFFLNPGVAFGIPIPGSLMSIVTPPIIIVLSGLFYKKYQNPKTIFSELSGLLLIIVGAFSNYLDRLLTHHTIDYLRLFYSVINLADIMIICGLIFVVRANYRLDKTS